MSWFSILPQAFSFVETWLIHLFLFLGALTIGPWLLLIFYDMILFIVRIIMYDVPIVGGRARNRPRPRAPSLAERPSGRPRGFSVNIPGLSTSQEAVEDDAQGMKQRTKAPGQAKSMGDVLEDE